ncbi:MAG: 2'-5' RNA ligase family protein [Cellulomonas sp.]
MKQLSPASDAPPPTHTAVIVPVPDAGRLVDEHRCQFDVAASWGVPAHVSVLYPFVEPAHVDGLVVETLTAVCDSVAAFDCRFSRTQWFGHDVLWLDPEPAQPFRDLTSAVWAAFPEYPPYAGAHDGVVPHLTIAESRLGSLTAVQRVEQAVQTGLPLSARIETVLLIAGTQAPNSWRILHEFRLGTARDVPR